MDISIAKLEKDRRELFQSIKPQIIRDLQMGKPALEVAEELEHLYPSPLKLLYTWVLSVEKELERKRKQIAVRGMVLFWLGLLFCSLGIVLQIVLKTETPFLSNISIPGILVLLGLSMGIPGISWATNASKFIGPKQMLDF